MADLLGTTLAPAPAPAAPGLDTFGDIEVRGIDYIPDDERHGRPRELFWVWAAANVTFLYLVLGAVPMLLGLTLWQSLAVVVVGNLFWIAVGWLSISGPASGTPSVTVMRAMFGVRGNRVLGAGLGWLICLGYEAVNLALGSLAAFALADTLGIGLSTPVKIAVVAAIAIVTLTLSIYGHATIARLSPALTVVLTVVFAALVWFVVRGADFSYRPTDALHGPDLAAMVLLGIAVIASSPLSWATGADYARYLPARTSSRAVAGWTALGGFLPAVVLGAAGVLAATVVDMDDAQTALAKVVPTWFYPILLFAIVLGSITNNVLTTYSSGLSLQGMGVPLKRSITVFIDGIVGVAVALYMLFVADSFLDSLSNALELSVVVLGPLMAIYAADIVLRRNAYDGVALNDESRTSPQWFRGGFAIPGVLAVVLGAGAALLATNSTIWEGPISTALDGADLSVLVGPVVAAVVYVVGTLLGRRAHQEASA